MSNSAPATTILMLSASPNRSGSHRLEQEKREIAEGLQRSRHRDQFRLEIKSAVRPRDLQRAMLDLNPQIVHFAGEGDGKAGLVFENESGQPQTIAAAVLAELFSQFADGLQCVVLNACYSEAQAEAIAQHIPYVIGMSRAIDERAAIEFAVGFYDALGSGRDIQFAYQFGCSAAQLSGESDLKPVLKIQPNIGQPRSITVAPTSSQPFSPAIYNASTWVERSELTEPLVQVLQEGCRVLTLTGMTGIGKTALAERLITELRDERRFARLNLDEGSVSAEFASSGAALLRSLGEEPTLEDQKDPQNLLAHLLQLLRSQPYRVQIDSMERLLEGDDRQGWSDFCDELWLNLLQQLLGGNDCQSQLILTTQESPGDLESVGSRYPQRWHCELVRGMSEAEQLELFAKRGIAERETDYLRRIGRLYEGHPLVLRVIAEDIKACGGNVQRYWQQGKFADLEANRPAQLSRRKLQLEVKQRVKDALARLPADALQLLCRSAVYRRPVPPSFWLAMLPERSNTEAALELLKTRGLAEEEWEEGSWMGVDGEVLLRQHNLIRSVAYEQLKTEEAVWQAAERTAAEQWLNHYEAVPEAPNLEKVRGYLEAFEHYCEVADWDEAGEIYAFQLTSTNQPFGRQLFIWGLYRELIQVSGHLLKGAALQTKTNCLLSLGNSHSCLGNQNEAIEYYQQALHFTREIGDQRGEGTALGNLGIAYRELGNYSQAIEFYQQALTIAREISDRKGEGNALGNLGTVYRELGNYSQAIEFYQQHLIIAREIGDRWREGATLGNLGIAYRELGNYSQAIEFYQQALTIAREIGSRQGESIALGNLGNVYYCLDNYSQAIEFHQQALTIAREISDRGGEGAALGSLGLAYFSLGKYSQAVEFHQQHLAIAREISDRGGEGAALCNLGEIQIKLGQYIEAEQNSQTALKIFQAVGDRSSEAEAFKKLAELHQKTRSIELARQECDRALAIATELGIPLVKECETLKQQLAEDSKDGGC